MDLGVIWLIIILSKRLMELYYSSFIEGQTIPKFICRITNANEK